MALSAWLRQLVPHLARLAALPFDRAAHEAYFTGIGWEVFRESWYPESCFEIHFRDPPRRLVAVYENSETGLAIGLCVFADSGESEGSSVVTEEEFNEVFLVALWAVMPLLDDTPILGHYHNGADDHPYHFAYWTFPQAFVTLVQHHEGDMHFGNLASLDLRLLPRRGSDSPSFPLETNILF